MKETIEQAARAYASCEVTEGGLTGVCGMDASKYEPFIAGAEWQANQSPWISVEERIPEHDNGQSLCEVLIRTSDDRCCVVANTDVEVMVKVGEATHWMPIPKV